MKRPILKKLMILTMAALVLMGFQGLSYAQMLINGAGASFPYPIYSKWFNEYAKLHQGIQINYQSIGSGGGIRQVTEGTVDFGATDGPMNDEQLQDFQKKRGTGVLHFPTVLGAVVVTYNIPGVNESLNLTSAVIADIYLGKITKWDDAAIKANNPKVKLPNSDIVVVHRSDGSGTSYCWTDYLSKVSPEWKSKVGKGTSVNWPVGLGGKGNEGVSGQVKQTAGSIGYVELIYAIQNKLPYANVKNAAGRFIKPDLASTTAAAAGAAKSMPADFRVSITDAPGKDAYPISTFTWLLIPETMQDKAKGDAIKDFMKWMLTSGQGMVEELSYARLPKEVVAQEQKALANLK
ncbi:MAG TPA: phosphate ABC transporter substrate-binding protein PstS [Acidobacteriota bacterium]|nr:phosphate ABC transporter substrate-binding protein PstS [Acidobacteriota bacterium]